MQQQTTSGPQTSLNTSKAKLSQIQSKPKSSVTSGKSADHLNKDISNDITVGSATSRATIESSQKVREKVIYHSCKVIKKKTDIKIFFGTSRLLHLSQSSLR